MNEPHAYGLKFVQCPGCEVFFHSLVDGKCESPEECYRMRLLRDAQRRKIEKENAAVARKAKAVLRLVKGKKK